jgi:outer membrane protein assembly factor BamB
MKSSLIKLTITFGLLITSITTFAQSDWSSACYSSSRTSFAEQEKELKPPLELEEIIPEYAYDFVAKNNVLYITVDDDPCYIKAYDLNKKEILWKFDIPNSLYAVGCIPAVSDTMLFAGAQKGDGLFAIDIRTGKQKWLKPIGNIYGRNPVLDNYGHVFIIKDSLYCLDANTGETVWTFDAAGQITPSVKNDTLFVTHFDAAEIINKISAINCNTGKVIWTTNVPYGITAQLPVDNKCVYYSDSHLACAYDIKTGIEKWRNILPGEYVPIRIYNPGNSCLTDSVLSISLVTTDVDDNMIVGINKFTGETLWKSLSGRYLHCPVAANGIIYIVPFYDPALIALNHTTGAVVFRDDSNNFDGSFIIANHKLYATSQYKIKVMRTQTTSADNITDGTATIEVYPNPVSEIVNIRLGKKSGNAKYLLFNLTGQLLEQRELESTDVKIDMTGYSGGSYILKISSNEQPMQSFKIIKR